MSFLKAAVDSSSPNILIPSGDFCTAFEGGVRIWSGAHLLRSVLSRNRWLWARAVSAWWFRSQIPVLISYRLFGVNLHHPILLMSLISEIRSTASALWRYTIFVYRRQKKKMMPLLLLDTKPAAWSWSFNEECLRVIKKVALLKLPFILIDKCIQRLPKFHLSSPQNN